MNHPKFSISIIALASILAPAANGATVSVVSNPSGVANLIAYSQESAGGSDIGVGDSRDIRQTFTVTENMKITSVFFRWKDNGTVTTDFSIDLNSDGDFGDANETILTTYNLPASTGDWIKIDLSADDLIINTGTSSLKWFSSGARGDNGELYIERTAQNYAGGDYFGVFAGSFTDVDFAVTAVAVPEPSSSALLALGGLALIIRRRK